MWLAQLLDSRLPLFFDLVWFPPYVSQILVGFVFGWIWF